MDGGGLTSAALNYRLVGIPSHVTQCRVTAPPPDRAAPASARVMGELYRVQGVY